MSSIKHPTLFLAILVSIPTLWLGGQTTRVEQRGLSTFLGAEMENLSLRYDGVVELAPELDVLTEADENLVMRAVRGPGGVVALSLGVQGKVVEVHSDGEKSELWEAGSLVRALAYDAEGHLWAAVSPRGRVYRLSSGSGPELVIETGEDSIWDMHFVDGILYLATGDRGRLLSWNPAEQKFGDSPELVYDADDRQITTLVPGPDGGLFLGTSPGGFLIHVDADGKATTLYKSELQEINSILPEKDGSVWFSAIGSGGSGSESSGPGSQGTPTPSGNNQPGSMQIVVSPGRPPRSLQGSSGGFQGVLYRLTPERFVQEVWKLPRVAILGLSNAPSGGVWIGTNHQGRVYHVLDETEWSLVHELQKGKEVSILSGSREDDTALLIASNPGVVYRLSSGYPESGTMLSPVLDAGQISRWGRVQLIDSRLSRPDGISLSVRGGNTPEPDSAWSDWQDWEDEEIRSKLQPSRFLQYKAVFHRGDKNENESPDLMQVIAYYQIPNAAPRINRIAILEPGYHLEPIQRTSGSTPSVALQQLLEGNLPSEPAAQPGRIQFRLSESPGTISVVWQAEDPNNDDLEYQIFLRGPGESDWFLVSDRSELPYFVLETLGMPEGFYQFRIVAKDHRSHPEGEGLSTSRLSQVFLVDNSPPAISRVSPSDQEVMAKGEVHLRVEDQWSRIVKAEFSLDGEPPVSLLPVGGMFDSRKLEFHIPIPLSDRSTSLLFRVRDEAGNTAVYREVLPAVP